MPQAELSDDAVDGIGPARRGDDIRKRFQALAVHDQHVAGLIGPPPLLEQSPKKELGCAHSESSRRTSATLIGRSPAPARALRTCPRKLVTASGSRGLSLLSSSTALG